MKADLTRDSFAPTNHFRQVLAQQGRVQLDAELNEQSALTARRDETTAADLIGDCGGPADAAAFGMSAIAGQPGDFLLSAGRYYVDGIQCELEAPVSYRQQPDLPGLPALPAGIHLVYLDVWQRHLTFLDDPRMLETALGGVDTTTRVKTVWQVRTLPVTGVPDCSGDNSEFTARTSPSTIRLQARTQLVAGANDPCQMAEGSGYKSLENQLYRVEVHSLLPADQARGVGRAAMWKWSRENASVEVPLKAVDVALKRLTVGSLGRDEKLGIRKGDFVELTDDVIELSGRHGDLIEVADVDEGDLTITLKTAPAILTTVDLARHPRVRRWEGTANVQANPWFDLEAGIQVKFADITVARPGDFWQIPARTSAPGAQAGTIEWPQTVPGTPDSLPPRGTVHHGCRLGFVTVSAGAPVFTDCRCLWPSLTGVPRLFYLGGDGQEVMPRAPFNKLPQPLIAGIANAHCADGPRVVRFTVIAGTGRVVVSGGTPTAATVDIPVNAAGEARCDFHLDRTTYSQQVRAELLDASGQAVRPSLTYNATLSVAREVEYDPGNCKGLGSAHTVQAAIATLAAAARVSAIGGDGQDGRVGEILALPLRVAVMSTCGPVEGATVVFSTREMIGSTSKQLQGEFAEKRTGPFVAELPVKTGSDGIALAFWQLPKTAVAQTLEAIATVKDFAGHPPEGPREIFFTANLRSQSVGTDEDPGAVHVVGVNFQALKPVAVGDPIATGTDIAVLELRQSILVALDAPLHPGTVATPQVAGNDDVGLPSNPVCFLTAELPWPLLASEIRDVAALKLPNVIVGFRPLILRAAADFEMESKDPKVPLPHRITINIPAETQAFLKQILAEMKRRKLQERLLIRLTLKGNFIWRETGKDELAKTGPAGWLDGDSWRVSPQQHPSSMQSLINDRLASGDRRRGGDFEMWFWLVPGKQG